jgi:N-methylhydantoinase A
LLPVFTFRSGSALLPTSLRVGIDVGGTFTDLFLLDEVSGVVTRHKLSSTPDDPYKAPIRGLVEILQKAGRSADEIGFVGLGTTVATNALLERKGAVTGLITTKGFRDLLEIGRQNRPDVYDLFKRRPVPLVSRERRVEVDERIAGDGEVLRELDEGDVHRAIERLRAEGCVSVAICFLNAYANPAHEVTTAALVRKHWPEAALTVSQELLPEFREYERVSSTVINASLMPVMKRYLSRFSEEVTKLGIPERPFVMNSGGGVVSPELAAERPIDTLLSGPSGGVSGAQYFADAVGEMNLLTFDMGGTSTDVSLVRDGRPEIAHARMIDGLPIKSTAIDIHTVGAGGSSVAWIDAGGMLRVGPHSAGANPGPACYGIGGEEPTVTDANVVLGRLNPHHLLDGAVPIDKSLSIAAIERVVGRAKGLSVEQAAAAILAVSNANIGQAIRFVSVQRGLNPQDFVLVAFGGAGPLHAAAVAQDLEMTVLVPQSPGVLCATGVLAKDVQIDMSRTRLLRQSDAAASQQIGSIFAELHSRAVRTLCANGLDEKGLVIERSIDARYVGQNFELRVPVSADALGAQVMDAVKAGFDSAHEQFYGFAQVEQEAECVTFRLRASLPVLRPELAGPAAAARAVPLQPRSQRGVFFESVDGFVDCAVYARADFRPGDELEGPAIIEQMDTTTVLPPHFHARVDAVSNLRLERADAQAFASRSER